MSDSGPQARWAVVAIALAGFVAGAFAYAASTRMSATFDEIILVSGGVRGLGEGRWDMITDQPPLMMYAYGAAALQAEPTRPAEDREWDFNARWDYARALFFGLGNDPQRLLGLARIVAAVTAALLVMSTAAFAWWAAGPVAGVLAAGLTATLPDVLAHGGVAYNDVPFALGFLLACWAMDAAVRKPGPRAGAVAGLAVVVAVGMKMSALALGPVLLALVTAEGWARRGDRDWWRELGTAAGVGVAVMYLAFVVLYRGDPTLTLLRFNFWRTVLHASGGHEAPAYLLGGLSPTGWWYYFPVVFFFKVPVVFQLLLAGGVASLAGRWLSGGASLGRLIAWRGRGALVGVLVFGAFLMRSDLNAGFRYALPVLPLFAVIAALGWQRLVLSPSRPWRPLASALIALQAIMVLSFFPHFLAFSSLAAGGRDDAHRVMVDSNIDWGQGLLELRRFMAEENVGSVYLSYFGSAPPEAYGIEYVALPSFFRLPLARTPGAEESPRFTVVSATNLHGPYLQGRDPFAPLRGRIPHAVLGHHLLVYDRADGG